MNNIGIFDSGIGGLGIFEEIKNLLPKESIVYLADSANCPYGEKSVDEIKKICRRNTQFLVDQGAKVVVVACNSASVSALNYIRSEFPDTPVVGVVPVVKTGAKLSKNKKIGILATKTTINSDYTKGLIKEFCSDVKVSLHAAGELVSLVEEIYIKKEHEVTKVLKKNVMPLVYNGVDVIILGCTHFPFLKDEIKKIVGDKVIVLDSNGAVARQVKRILEKNERLESKNEAEYVFYSTKAKGILKIQINKLLDYDTGRVYLLKWK